MGKKNVSLKKITEFLEDHHDETLQKTRHLQDILIHLQYEGKPSFGKNLKQAREVLRFFEHEVSDHMGEEEKILFPFLQAHVPKLEPLISLLCSEHRTFKKNLGCFKFLLAELAKSKSDMNRSKIMEKVKETGNHLTYLLQSHLEEESEILYRAADRELRKDEKRELASKISCCGTGGGD